MSLCYHSPVILSSFWLHSNAILLSLYCHSGIILASISYHSDVIQMSLWCHSNVFLMSRCCHSRVILTSLWCYIGCHSGITAISLKSFFGHSGVIQTSFWWHFDVTLTSFWSCHVNVNLNQLPFNILCLFSCRIPFTDAHPWGNSRGRKTPWTRLASLRE
jgi:hypothetical protein